MKNSTYIQVRHLSLMLFASLFFLACKETKKNEENTGTAKETITITHQLGTVELEKEPTNVVALNYAALENLDALGIPVVGIPKSHVPSYLETYKNDPNVTDLGTIFEVDYEKLNDLNPGVIFISARMLKNYDELSKIAPTVYLETEQGEELNSVTEHLALFGKIFNKEAAATDLADQLKNQVQELRDTVVKANKNALIVMHNNGKFSAFGKASRFGIIHNLFGFKEAQEGLDTARHGQAVSNEFIQKVNPDYLFVVDRSAVVNKSATNKKAIENVLIQETDAFKNGRIVYLNPEAWYLSGDGVTSFGIMAQEVKTNF